MRRLAWILTVLLASTAAYAGGVPSIPSAPINSPNFGGTPTVPTATPGTSTLQIASTAFVSNAVAASTTGVSSFDARTGAISLIAADVTGTGVFNTALPSISTATPVCGSGAAGGVTACSSLTVMPSGTAGTTQAAGNATTAIATDAFVAAAVAVEQARATAAAGSQAPLASPTFTGTVTIPAGAAIAGYASLASPTLTGTPAAPTATAGTNTTQLATTAFVQATGFQTAAQAAAAAPVQSVAGRTGAVTVTVGDVAGAAPLASPTFTGTPSVPGYATTSAAALLAPLASPALTGTPTAPTPTTGANTTQIATTAFDTNAVGVETSRATAAEALKAPLASPTLTGTPSAPTAAGGTNTTQLATTAFVQNQGFQSASQAAADAPVQSVAGRTGAVTVAIGDVAGAAPLASPTFTGTPIAPTAAVGTSTTQLATTAFVGAAVGASASGVSSVNTRTGAVTLALSDIPGAAPLASPTFTGAPVVPGYATTASTALLAPLATPVLTGGTATIMNAATTGTAGAPNSAALQFARTGQTTASVTAGTLGADFLAFSSGVNTERVRLAVTSGAMSATGSQASAANASAGPDITGPASITVSAGSTFQVPNIAFTDATQVSQTQNLSVNLNAGTGNAINGTPPPGYSLFGAGTNTAGISTIPMPKLLQFLSTLSYTAGSSAGSDTFTVQIYDGAGNQSTLSIPVTITAASTATNVALQPASNQTVALGTSSLPWSAGYFTNETVSGVLTVPTATVGTNTTQAASTAFVAGAVSAATAGVSSVNTRTGAVTLALADIPGAAPLASPALTGTPTAPSPPASTNSTQIATIGSVYSAIPYTQTSNPFCGSGNNGVVGVCGNNMALPNGAVATTQAVADNTTKVATDAFVIANAGSGGVSAPTISAAVAAAGTTQGTATSLASVYDVITSGAVNTGVILTILASNPVLHVINETNTAKLVYPQTSATIMSAGVTNAANTAVSVPAFGTATLLQTSTTSWVAY